jgi:hypothetical protein
MGEALSFCFNPTPLWAVSPFSSIPLPFGRSRVLSPTPVPQGLRPLDSGAKCLSLRAFTIWLCRSRRVR